MTPSTSKIPVSVISCEPSQYMDFDDFCTRNGLSKEEGFKQVIEGINYFSTAINKIKGSETNGIQQD